MISCIAMQPSPIQEAIRPVLELFATELSDVRFPDIDLAVLRETAASVAAQVDAVARAEEALAEARAILVQCEQALASKAARALAYARVYAEGDGALVSKIDAIALPRTPNRRARADASFEAPTEPASDAETSTDAKPRRGRPPRAGRTIVAQSSLELAAADGA
jgi:hypothetical protein